MIMNSGPYIEQYERRGVTLILKNFLIPKYKLQNFQSLEFKKLQICNASNRKTIIAQQYHIEMTSKNQIMFFPILAIGIVHAWDC